MAEASTSINGRHTSLAARTETRPGSFMGMVTEPAGRSASVTSAFVSCALVNACPAADASLPFTEADACALAAGPLCAGPVQQVPRAAISATTAPTAPRLPIIDARPQPPESEDRL